jgi:chromosomal replication initiation ATPase DnaA
MKIHSEITRKPLGKINDIGNLKAEIAYLKREIAELKEDNLELRERLSMTKKHSKQLDQNIIRLKLELNNLDPKRIHKKKVKPTWPVLLEIVRLVFTEQIGDDLLQDFHTSKFRGRDNSVLPRQVFMYFADLYYLGTLQSIGKFCGHRDHTTVLHAKRTINDLLEYEDYVKLVVGNVQEMIDNLSDDIENK